MGFSVNRATAHAPPDGPPAGANVALVAIVAIVIGTRLWQARESLWLDELHTAWTAMGPWNQVALRAAEGNQSPAFFWFEWLLTQVFGANEFTLRAPSLVAGALLPVLLYRTARQWTGSACVALLPAWLTAVEPLAISFGTEARPYAVIQVLAVLHVALFGGLVFKPTFWRRTVFVIGAAVLFYLHYTTLLVVAGEVSFYLILRLGLKEDTTYSWRALSTDVLAVGVLALGALPGLRAVYAHRGNWAAFVEQRPLWQGLLMTPWAWTGLGAVAAIAGVRRAWRGWRGWAGNHAQVHLPNDTQRHSTALVLCWLLVPVLIAWAATATDAARLLHPRYVAAAAPAAVLLVALAVGMLPQRRWQHAASIAIAVVAMAGSRIPQTMWEHRQIAALRTDDWRGAVNFVNQQPHQDGNPILVRSLLIECDGLGGGNDARLRDYCLYPVTSLYRIDVDTSRLIPLRRMNAWAVSADDSARLRGATGFWLIVDGSAESGNLIQSQFLQLVEASRGDEGPRADDRWMISQRRSFGTIHVARLDRETP